MNPLVTIIILCYDEFQYVYQALNSVLKQDYPNIELIVSDDASENFPEERIRTYIEKHAGKNITAWYINRNEKHVGTVKHLNIVAKLAKGEYFMSVSADDTLDNPEVVSTYVQELSTKSDMDILMAQVAMCGEKVKDIHYYFVQPHIREILLHHQDSNALFNELVQHPYLPSVSTFFRHTFFEKHGYFDESYHLVEDWPLHLKIAREHIPVLYVDFVAVCHRSGGVSHRNKEQQDLIYNQYLTDLQDIYTREVQPYLDQVPKDIRERVAHKHRVDAAWSCWITTYRGTGLKGTLQYLFRFFDIELYKRLPQLYHKLRGKQWLVLLAGLLIGCFGNWASAVIGYSGALLFPGWDLYVPCMVLFSVATKVLVAVGAVVLAVYYIAKLFVLIMDIMQLYF
ncbi:glycosyltransferase [Oscillibacter valericigenes]|uniref:glycosyltransferase n=1 Tax=Oscillibacter valericigenes TaxID=351091 RepID=UPI001F3BDC13|nr:glycosyltransferase [Oscillibacter valericigenes]MCF2617852.1 glycosyltransferase [Oscillibacter valericigenes]